MKTATALVHVSGYGQITIHVEDEETQGDLYKLSNEELNDRIIDWKDVVDNCIEEIDFDEIIIDKEK